MMKKVLSLLTILMLLLTVHAATADDSNSLKDDGFSTSYSYIFDYWGDVQMCPDPYRVLTVVDSSTIGLENLDNLRISNPEGLFARNHDIYVADTGNNRILQLKLEGDKVTLKRIITEISGAEPATLKCPTYLFVDENDNIYIADYNNHRVLMADKDLNKLKEFTNPDDSTFNQGSDFLPSKITVDVAGRLYVLAKNVNKGFMKY